MVLSFLANGQMRCIAAKVLAFLESEVQLGQEIGADGREKSFGYIVAMAQRLIYKKARPIQGYF